MNAQSTRRLSAALALAVGIGLCQPAMAQQNGGEEGQTPHSEEETRPATLEEMWHALQAALEKLRNTEHRIAELQAIVQNRKRLAVRLATGLSRSTETPVYSVEEGSRAIALARAALDAANAALAAAQTDREAAQAAVDAARIA